MARPSFEAGDSQFSILVACEPASAKITVNFGEAVRLETTIIQVEGEWTHEECYYSIEMLLLAVQESEQMPRIWKVKQSAPVKGSRELMLACNVFSSEWDAYVHYSEADDKFIVIEMCWLDRMSERVHLPRLSTLQTIKAYFDFIREQDLA